MTGNTVVDTNIKVGNKEKWRLEESGENGAEDVSWSILMHPDVHV